MFNRFDSARQTVASLLQRGGYYTGMIGKWHLGSDPVGFDRWEILPGQGAYANPILYTATGEKTYTGRYVTDVITDLAIEFMEEPAARQAVLPDGPPQGAAPAVGARRAQAARVRRRDGSRSRETFWDSYATRTDALHENQQRVADDLTRPRSQAAASAGPRGTGLTAWLATKPTTVTIMREAASVTLTGEALARWKYQRYMQDYLATVQSRRRQRRPPPQLPRSHAAWRRTRSSIYTSDQGFFLGDHGMFDKRFMYEEALRMPFLVRWPAAHQDRARRATRSR